MKTKITRSKGYIALIIDNPKEANDKDVLAAMTLHEGTGCWRLIDVRLAQYRSVSKYSGSCYADDFHAEYAPKSPEEAEFVKSLLREFEEHSDGSIHWCTFEGIVRGSQTRRPTYISFDQAGFFSQIEGLAKMKEIKRFWESL